MTTDIPTNEMLRLENLHSYEILDTPSDGAFDDLTLIATEVFGVPIAIVSLVDENRIWFKSAHGLDGTRQIDRGPGLCASAIISNDLYIASDLRRDPNSLANPLVARDNGFRFYAAIPLTSPKGYNLGTFCIIDKVPRDFPEKHKTLLKCFGRLVMSQLEQRLSSREIASLAVSVSQSNKLLSYAANHDPLTGLLNRRSISLRMSELGRSEPNNGNAVLLLDVDDFKFINDTHGHAVGDLVLIEISAIISQSMRAPDFVGRFGGEEFLVILENCSMEKAIGVADRIRKNVAESPIDLGDSNFLNVTISGGLCRSMSGMPIDGVLRRADAALYKAKRSGKNQIVVI